MEDKALIEKIRQHIEQEPYTRFFNIKVKQLLPGHSVVSMTVKEDYNNIFGISHGGAIFSLVDVAFGSAANSYGTVAVALNVNINYLRPANAKDELTAEAKEINRSNKVASFFIIVKNNPGKTIATAHALAYLKSEKLPFLQ